MNFGEYGEAVVEGFKSILNATIQWRDNPLTSQVNRRMWGRWWAATLTLLTLTTLWIEAVLPPFSSLIGLVPPLTALSFIPRVVCELLLSAPALFAFVVVWRVRHLRSSARDGWQWRAQPGSRHAKNAARGPCGPTCRRLRHLTTIDGWHPCGMARFLPRHGQT